MSNGKEDLHKLFSDIELSGVFEVLSDLAGIFDIFESDLWKTLTDEEALKNAAKKHPQNWEWVEDDKTFRNKKDPSTFIRLN